MSNSNGNNVPTYSIPTSFHVAAETIALAGLATFFMLKMRNLQQQVDELQKTIKSMGSTDVQDLLTQNQLLKQYVDRQISKINLQIENLSMDKMNEEFKNVKFSTPFTKQPSNPITPMAETFMFMVDSNNNKNNKTDKLHNNQTATLEVIEEENFVDIEKAFENEVNEMSKQDDNVIVSEINDNKEISLPEEKEIAITDKPIKKSKNSTKKRSTS